MSSVRQSRPVFMESLDSRIQCDSGVVIIVGPGPSSIYNAPASYSSRGTSPQGLVWGDFNKDGKPDIAFTNAASNTLGVMLNKGNGTFNSPTIYTGVGTKPGAVTTTDFNGDKILDLAIVGGDLSVMLGKGNGTFNAALHIPVGSQPSGIAYGDVNKDGYYDIVTTNAKSNTISTVLNRGKGRWYGASNSTAGSGPFGLAIADYTGDGKLDVAVTNMGEGLSGTSVGVRILVGNNTGKFVAGKLLKAGTRPISIASADLNKDGKLDLVTANGGYGAKDGQNTISVLLGLGSGNFAERRAFEAGAGASSVAIGDFNRDKNLDVIVSNYSASTVSLLKGNGAGSFTLQETLNGGKNNINVIVSDFNMDGLLDIATTGYGGASVVVYLRK